METGNISFGPGLALPILGFSVAVVLQGVVKAGDESKPSTPDVPTRLRAPEVSGVDRVFLTDLARRVAQANVSGQQHTLHYVPPTLKNLTCRVGVTFRQYGRYRGGGVSEAKPVVAACTDAATLAIRSLPTDLRTPQHLRKMRVDVELLSKLVELKSRINDVAGLRGEALRGLDGLALLNDGRFVFLRPSEWRAENLIMGGVVRELLKRASIPLTEKESKADRLTLFKMRSTHWVEPARRSVPPVLSFGVVHVRPEDVTKESVSSAVRAAGQYLLYRQNPGGVFAYQYLPSKDKYAERDDWVQQAGAMWTLSRYARWSGDEPSAKAADKCVQAFVPLLTPIPKRPQTLYVMLPNGPQKLGLTALYLLAIMDHPNAEAYYYGAARVIAAILGQQQEDGRLLADFPPGALKSSQTVYPAEALLALTRVLRVQPNKSIKATLSRALPFYYNYFHENPSTVFVAWQSMTYGAMARMTRERKYADFIFEMTDHLVELQLTAENCPWPELHGALALHGPTSADFLTGLYVMGLAEALKTARAFKDTSRARRYEQTIRRATRFVMQLQFRPDECYYVRSRRDVLGGIRTSLSNNALRLDGTAWGLGGLLSAWEVLFVAQPKER